jgi:hypothetical protein
VSDTLWLEIRDGATRTGRDRDHSILLRLTSELDSLAARLGVSPLSAFHDFSAVARAYANEVGDSEAAAAQPGTWHDAARGLRTVEAILQELWARPQSLAFTPDKSRRHWFDELMRELEDSRGRLENASNRGLTFRLLIVP